MFWCGSVGAAGLRFDKIDYTKQIISFRIKMKFNLKNIIKHVAIAMGITVGMSVVTAILYFGAAFVLGVIANGIIPKWSDAFFVAFADYVQIIAVFVVLFLYEKTHAETITYIKIKKANIPQFLVGMITGAAIILIIIAIMQSIGAISMEKNCDCSFGWLVVLMGGVIIQSASEEYIFRGYLLPGLLEHIKRPRAIVISSIVFSLVHIGFAGTTWLYLVNLVLLGVLLSEITLLTGNVMAAVGVHAAINFLAEMGLGGMSYSCFTIVPITENAQGFSPLNSIWGIYVIAFFAEVVSAYKRIKEKSEQKV